MSTATLLERVKTIWNGWRHLIILGGFIGTYMIGFYFWSIHQADLPIVESYRRYLDHLVTHSGKAHTYEAAYFREHKRQTVASRHFEHVCSVMTTLAVEDGFKLSDYPDFPSVWCHERSGYFSEFLQPK